MSLSIHNTTKKGKGKRKRPASPDEISPISKHRKRNNDNVEILENKYGHLPAPKVPKKQRTGARTRGTGNAPVGRDKDTCFYIGCRKTFSGKDTPIKLRNHIVNDHIGGVLDGPFDLSGGTPVDLQCLWQSCKHGYSDDRDKAVSHCLVHVPAYRPFECGGCGSEFQEEGKFEAHKAACKHKDE